MSNIISKKQNNNSHCNSLASYLADEKFLNKSYFYFVNFMNSGADQGGTRVPPTLDFEAPKLSIFGPYLIFP